MDFSVLGMQTASPAPKHVCDLAVASYHHLLGTVHIVVLAVAYKAMHRYCVGEEYLAVV